MSTTATPHTPATAATLICPDCHGNGAVYAQVRDGLDAQHPFVCTTCDGDGEVPERASRELVDQVIQRAAALAAQPQERVQGKVTEEALTELLEALGNVHMQLRDGERATDSDIAVKTPVILTRDQIEEWAGTRLTPCEIERLTNAIPHSSIPEAVGEIVAGIRGHR